MACRTERGMTDPTAPGLEFVFRIEAEIERPRSAGASRTGERLHIPIIGGRVEGSRLHGHVLPGGSDWPVIGADGNSRIEAHYTIEADDGTLIYVVNKALRVSTPDVTARLRAGEVVAPGDYYMRGSPVFDAPDGPHEWLRENVFVCSIAPKGLAVVIDVFQIT